MIRITKQTDYGIVLLSCFARDAAAALDSKAADFVGDPRSVHNARDLAHRTTLPLPMVSQILKLMARQGLLESLRGVKGGYRLRRRPEDISVADIIAALEGPIALTECIGDAPGDCEQEPRCPMRSPWQRINLAIRRALEQVSLSEIAAPSEAESSSLVHLHSPTARVETPLMGCG